MIARQYGHRSRRLDGNSHLRRQGFRNLLVFRAKNSRRTVQRFEDSDDLAVQLPERHCQDGSGAVAATGINRLIEAGVSIGVGHVYGLTSPGGQARNTGVRVKAEYLVASQRNLRPELLLAL